jgi:hypothetical protein
MTPSVSQCAEHHGNMKITLIWCKTVSMSVPLLGRHPFKARYVKVVVECSHDECGSVDDAVAMLKSWHKDREIMVDIREKFHVYKCAKIELYRTTSIL